MNQNISTKTNTWKKSTVIIVIVVSITYGMWFNLLDSLTYCQSTSESNHSFTHQCTSIGQIFAGSNEYSNQFYQPWNIIGHCLPGLFMALMFREKKLELFVAGVLISTVVMDSPLWGFERKFFHGLPLWDGIPPFTYNVVDWIKYYYNPVGFYSVWDTNWLFPNFPNAVTIFWSLVARITAAILLIWYQHREETNGRHFSLKSMLIRK